MPSHINVNGIIGQFLVFNSSIVRGVMVELSKWSWQNACRFSQVDQVTSGESWKASPPVSLSPSKLYFQLLFLQASHQQRRYVHVPLQKTWSGAQSTAGEHHTDLSACRKTNKCWCTTQLPSTLLDFSSKKMKMIIIFGVMGKKAALQHGMRTKVSLITIFEMRVVLLWKGHFAMWL